MAAKKFTRAQKLDALYAAREWLGRYDGDDAPIDEGGREVPQDMLDGYELLGQQINELLALNYYDGLVAALKKQNPDAAMPRVRQAAKSYMKKHPESVPTLKEVGA